MNKKQKKMTVALVAHDNKKKDLISWCKHNKKLLEAYRLTATGTTGKLLQLEVGVEVQRLQSGPLGGDMQLGAMIAEGDVDFLVFFWDPLEAQPHDPDIKALLRLAAVWNIPVACNQATADYIFTSRLLNENYDRQLPEFEEYLNRRVD
jgi:methylglyoxal synthase